MNHPNPRTALVAALLLVATGAQASPELIKLRTTVFQEQTVRGADGQSHTQRVPATRVEPGSEVVYEVGYSNTGSEPMQVIITNPMPEDLVYQSYAARAVGAQIQVSVDGGRSFGPLEQQRARSDSGAPRAATARDITHVRWTTARPVKPGEAGYVSLRATVK